MADSALIVHIMITFVAAADAAAVLLAVMTSPSKICHIENNAHQATYTRFMYIYIYNKAFLLVSLCLF